MVKALFKKQFLEINTFYFYNKKTGKRRNTAGTVGMILLFLFIFIGLGAAFGSMAKELVPLVFTPYSWLYFSITSMIALVFGVFGSVFNTYAGLYHSKDNDLLLSMPIPSHIILITRISGVALMSLLYESLIMVPVIIVRFIYAPVNALTVIFSVLLVFVLDIAITAITCILGFGVAALTSKIKNKSIFTVIFSLAFIAIYYIVYFKAFSFLQELVTNGKSVSNTVRVWFAPFYAFGLAAEGNVLSFILFTLGTAVVFAVVLLLVSKTFMGLATAKEQTNEKNFTQKQIKSANVSSALLKREFKRYLNNPTYILNCSLATLLMPVAGVVMLFKMNDVEHLKTVLADFSGALPIFAAAAICLISAMNDLTAPSVSLEGKTFWQLKCLPVSSSSILKAKENLHLILTVPPALFLTVCTAIALKLDITTAVLMIALVLICIMFNSKVGLLLDLNSPNFNWTNVVVPIKQSMPVLIALFGGFFVAILIGLAGFFLADKLSNETCFCIIIVVLAVASRFISKLVYEKGKKVFG